MKSGFITTLYLNQLEIEELDVGKYWNRYVSCKMHRSVSWKIKVGLFEQQISREEMKNKGTYYRFKKVQFNSLIASFISTSS